MGKEPIRAAALTLRAGSRPASINLPIKQREREDIADPYGDAGRQKNKARHFVRASNYERDQSGEIYERATGDHREADQDRDPLYFQPPGPIGRKRDCGQR